MDVLAGTLAFKEYFAPVEHRALGADRDGLSCRHRESQKTRRA